MSDLGLAYQEYDFYEELFEKPKRIKRKKEPIKKFQLNLRMVPARTTNQQIAYDYFEQEEHLILHGLAGTGKTFITLYLALKRLFEPNCYQDKVVIVRSVVPTREMGFLPGSEKEKMKNSSSLSFWEGQTTCLPIKYVHTLKKALFRIIFH